jgi:hypothetical protein
VHVARPEVAPQLLLADQGLDEAILHHGPPQEEQEAARRHEPQEEGQDDAQEGQQRGDGRDEVRQAPEEEGHRHERGSRRRSRDPAGSHSPKKVFKIFDGRGSGGCRVRRRWSSRESTARSLITSKKALLGYDSIVPCDHQAVLCILQLSCIDRTENDLVNNLSSSTAVILYISNRSQKNQSLICFFLIIRLFY